MRKFLITGGCGFIGSNFIRYLFKNYPEVEIVNLDLLTYAGNLDNLADISDRKGYRFIKGDISDKDLINDLKSKIKFDCIFNFAAESHVDRSILDPDAFIRTNIQGTKVLLDAVKEGFADLFVQISTDEVYGSVENGSFTEESPLQPSSPYSASKAAADLLVLSYFKTFNLPVKITRSCNNFGPYQHPEKLIPLFITNCLEGKKVPLYGDGKNIREWLYVEDCCKAIDTVARKSKIGEVYNIGSSFEIQNIDLTKKILSLTKKDENLIQFVKDRPGHDRRYSLDWTKIKKELQWEPEKSFEEGLELTVEWYKNNKWWWEKLKGEEFKKYYKKNYGLEY